MFTGSVSKTVVSSSPARLIRLIVEPACAPVAGTVGPRVVHQMGVMQRELARSHRHEGRPAAIDVDSNVRTLLPRQDGKPLRGVDGLTRCGDTYFAIYNGASPGRLLTIRMRPGGVEYGELIDGLELSDPTQLAFDGKRLLIVADSGWELATKGTPRTKGAAILAIPLGKDCKPL